MTVPTVTRIKLPAVRRAISSTVWAMQEHKLKALLEVVEQHAAHGGFSREDTAARLAASGRSGGKGRRSSPPGGIQILSLYGTISQRMDMLSEFSGGTSCLDFSDQFDAAMNDESVGAIVIDCDSPGGNVSGVPELAARIFAARGKGKSITAVANVLMASAAYWICSAADEIVVSPSGEVGSIGVFTVHEDDSEANAKAGIKFTIIRAGAHKAERSHLEPLSADAEAHLASQVNEFNAMFVGATARYRGVSAKVVEANYGQGRTLLAQAAVKAGMADRVDTLENVLTKLGAKGIGASGRPVRALVSGNIRADDGPMPERPAPPDDDDPEAPSLCPECGTPMDDDDEACESCGYVPNDSASATSQLGAGALAAALPNSPDHRPHEAQELPMPGTDTAQAGADKNALEAALAADRERSAEIRRVAKKHSIPETEAEAMVSEGLTVDAACARIIKSVDTRAGGAPRIQVGADREAERPFKNLGEFIQAAAAESTDEWARRQASGIGLKPDRRLRAMQAAVTGAGSTLGSDGGFAVQTDHGIDLEKLAFATGLLASSVDSVEIGADSDSLEITYIDETSRATGQRFGGVQVYRGAEADIATQAKPKFGNWELRLSDLIGLYYATDRLMRDASALSGVVQQAFTEEFAFTLDDEILNGTGGPKCQGIIGAPANYVQAKDVGQAAATITATNIQNMWKHMPHAWRTQANWYINQDCESVLQNMQIGLGVSGALVYMPPGGLSSVPYGTIYGRPVIPVEQAAALGTPGDIILFNPKQYRMIKKGGLESAISIHVMFTSNQWTLRWIMRANGAPKLKTTIAPYKGSTTLSPIITLAAR